MTIFYICRHGQTENNRNGRLSGWIDTPLTAEGVANAASTAAKLSGVSFDAVIASDLGRAFITAYLVVRQVGYDGEIKRLAGLREVNYGELSNQPIVAYPLLTPIENTTFAPPGGESLRQMQERVLECVHHLSARHAGQTILLVAHDGTINALYAAFAGQNIGEVDASSHNAHDFVAKFEYNNGALASFAAL